MADSFLLRLRLAADLTHRRLEGPGRGRNPFDPQVHDGLAAVMSRVGISTEEQIRATVRLEARGAEIVAEYVLLGQL